MTQATRALGFRGERFAFDAPQAALDAVVARIHAPAATETLALALAGGRILAESVALRCDSPPFDHSAMDGYAISASAGDSDAPLQIVGESRIGRASVALTNARAAIRISTGSPLPQGCDRVIMREDVEEIHDAVGAAVAIRPTLGALAKLTTGANVRRRAENGPSGTVVAEAGSTITAASIAAIATAGVAEVRVASRLRVACITTGDELCESGADARGCMIANSNLPALSAALRANAWVDLAVERAVGDAVDAVTTALSDTLSQSDAVVMTGGVSMGHRDPMREALARVGATVLFHGLPQRPGKPMLVASVERASGAAQLVFCLPGNPVSALVTFVRVALPALHALAGGARADSSASIALSNDDGKRLELWWHRLVRLEADGRARLVTQRGSGDLVALGMSSGFVEVAPGSAVAPNAPVGELFRYFPWPH